MNHHEEIFFELLQSAIWDKVPKLNHVPTEKEWNDIYTISKEQTVTGIMLDAISKLPAAQMPPRKLLLQWIAAQKFIEKSNNSMNKELINIYNELNKKNICTYLLKGQGVAQLYPIPEHRVCGDIDLYFKEKDLCKAIDYFTSIGCKIDDEDSSPHAETDYKGINIELHKRSSTFYTKKLQRRYNAITDNIIKSNKEYIAISGTEIEIFPPVLNALQQLSHMLRHILTSGLGLRRVCDWVLFIHKNLEHIDMDSFTTYMKELQLFNTYKAITVLSIEHLGLPEHFASFDITKDDKLSAKKIMSHIMAYGNFGHYGEHSYFETNWEYIKSYIWKIRNCVRFRKLSKSEAWNYPIWQLHSISKIIKK